VSRVVRLTKAAEEDLREARQWYLKEAPHVASAFRREVRETHQRISENPWQSPDVHRGIRRRLVHRFPYAVFYRVEAEAVQVIAITHQARDPRVWKRRS
jgi:plasmid stabilization system protein ParE